MKIAKPGPKYSNDVDFTLFCILGLAVVTMTEAKLWTDGRYFLQAEKEMDCNWDLMKIGNLL